MIFLTVGTQFPFDRLVKSVDEVVSQDGFSDDIFAQIGESSYRPHNFEAVSFLEKRLFDKHIREASGIISHAGIGTIMMALDDRKPLLVMPRLKEYGEVVGDHQVAISRKFEELGHILVAHSKGDLLDRIKKLQSFVPQQRTNQAEVTADRITKFLYELSSLRKS